MNEPLTSNPRVSIHEAAAVGKKLRQDHISSGAAWSFEDWLTIRYEELRRRFERACARITELESAAVETSARLPHEPVEHIRGAKDCEKCGGAGWLYGRELDDADEETVRDTMTKYSCDGVKCRDLRLGVSENARRRLSGE